MGPVAARALIQCGFGEKLVQTWRRYRPHPPDLRQWRADLQREIHTNSMNQLGRPLPYIDLPASFPDLEVLEWYLEPKVSVLGSHGGGALHDRGNLDLGRLAALCEDKFDEWGFRETIIKRFRGVDGNIWHPAVTNVLRRAAIEVSVTSDLS